MCDCTLIFTRKYLHRFWDSESFVFIAQLFIPCNLFRTRFNLAPPYVEHIVNLQWLHITLKGIAKRANKLVSFHARLICGDRRRDLQSSINCIIRDQVTSYSMIDGMMYMTYAERRLKNVLRRDSLCVRNENNAGVRMCMCERFKWLDFYL